MPAYLIYFVDADGHIYQPPQPLKCADDQEAIEKARQYIDGKDIQVWEKNRLVARFPHQHHPVGRLARERNHRTL